MREERPLIAWEEGHQILLDLHRVRVLREGSALADARDMAVDDDALVPIVRVTEDDVRGLPADAGELDELLHRRRYEAIVLIGDRGRHANQTAGFVAEVARALDLLLQ